MSDEILHYNASCLTIEEGISGAATYAADHGFRVDLVRINANSFITMCLGLNRLITPEKENFLFIKVKMPDGGVDSVPIEAHDLPQFEAEMCSMDVLETRCIFKVTLSS